MSLLLDDDECTPTTVVAQRPQACEAAAPSSPSAVFRVEGGNGLEKMSALAYGTPRVTISGKCSKSTPPTTKVQRAHATQSSIIPPPASAASTPAPSQRVELTPTSQVTTPAAATLTAEKEATPGVGVARTLMTTMTDEESPLPPKKKPCLESNAAAAPTSSSPKSKEVAHPKQQMKLSDFFSKMACKK